MSSPPKRRRYRTQRAKPGELRAFYGRVDTHSGPDLCYAWGPGTHRADSSLLHDALTSDRLTFDFPTTNTKFAPSFVKELEQRGYDLTTLKFSIRKKDAAPECRTLPCKESQR